MMTAKTALQIFSVYASAVFGITNGAMAATIRPAVFVGGDFRNMPTSVCALKAVEAMGVQQNFIYAQVQGTGAWGYDEQSVVIVHAFTVPGGLQIFVVAISSTNREAERLRNVIRQHVFDGPYNPLQSSVYRTTDPTRRQSPLAVHWGGTQTAYAQNKFRRCATDTMLLNNLQEFDDGNRVVFGTGQNVVVTAIGVQASRGTTALVIAASPMSFVAEHYRNSVRANIGCVAFDTSRHAKRVANSFGLASH